MDNLNRYIFISGTGRSGSNITKDLLSKHPDTYALPFEYRFTIDPDGLISTYNILKNIWSPFQASIAIDRLESLLFKMEAVDAQQMLHQGYDDWELGKWFPNYNEYVKVLIKDLSQISYNGNWPGVKTENGNNIVRSTKSIDKSQIVKPFRNFLTILYNDLLELNHAKCLIEDNTWSLLFAADLLTILPEIKFIHVIRDPRDIISSIVNQRWCPSNLPDCINFYKSIVSRISQQIERIPEKAVVHIKIEDLVRKYDETMQLLSDFIGLDYSQVYGKELLSNSSFGRYKTHFNNEEINQLDSELKKELRLFNY